MKRYIALLLALMMIVACSACGSGGGGSTAGVDSDTLIIGTTNDVTIPFDNTSVSNVNGLGLCYDKLTYLDPYTGERVSNVLEDWYYEDDLHLVLKIKEGVTFTDGTPLTGEDLIYTFSDEIDRGGTNANVLVNFDWDMATVSDDGLTVTIPTYEEYAPGIASLSSWIENKAFDEAHPADDEVWWNTVQGTGPYYCVEQVDGAYSTYALRENYWGSEAYMYKTITFKYYADMNALFIDYENGEINVALNIGSFNYDSAMNGGVADTTVKLEGDGNPITFCLDYTRVEAWNNPLVRQAIAHAINIDDLGVAGFEGLYKIDGSIIPESAAYYKRVGTYEYDLELSRQLLEEAGYADGFSFTLVTYEKYEDMAEALQDMMAKIGVDMQLDIGQMMPQLKKMLAGEADAIFLNGTTDNSGEPSLAYQKLVTPTDNVQAASVLNPEWNELLASSYTMDLEKREQIIHEIQDSFYENVWQVTLLEKCEAWCYRNGALPEGFEAYIGGVPTFRVLAGA